MQPVKVLVRVRPGWPILARKTTSWPCFRGPAWRRPGSVRDAALVVADDFPEHLVERKFTSGIPRTRPRPLPGVGRDDAQRERRPLIEIGVEQLERPVGVLALELGVEPRREDRGHPRAVLVEPDLQAIPVGSLVVGRAEDECGGLDRLDLRLPAHGLEDVLGKVGPVLLELGRCLVLDPSARRFRPPCRARCPGLGDHPGRGRAFLRPGGFRPVTSITYWMPTIETNVRTRNRARRFSLLIGSADLRAWVRCGVVFPSGQGRAGGGPIGRVPSAEEPRILLERSLASLAEPVAQEGFEFGDAVNLLDRGLEVVNQAAVGDLDRTRFGPLAGGVVGVDRPVRVDAPAARSVRGRRPCRSHSLTLFTVGRQAAVVEATMLRRSRRAGRRREAGRPSRR